jgi:uncharacterized protein
MVIQQHYITQIYKFKTALEYYNESSSIKFLKNITKPTLIIQTRNDPMIPISIWPRSVDLNENISFIESKYGGHVGFMTKNINIKKSLLDFPKDIVKFFNN